MSHQHMFGLSQGNVLGNQSELLTQIGGFYIKAHRFKQLLKDVQRKPWVDIFLCCGRTRFYSSFVMFFYKRTVSFLMRISELVGLLDLAKPISQSYVTSTFCSHFLYTSKTCGLIAWWLPKTWANPHTSILYYFFFVHIFSYKRGKKSGGIHSKE